MGLKLCIPRALPLLALVLLVACSNGDDAEEVETLTPLPASAGTTVVGRNISFSTDTLSATVGQPVTITFVNQDSVDLHNFHVLAGSQGDFKTEIRFGPDTQSLTFTINMAGAYRFQCDTHPDQMNGTLTVQ